VIKKKSSLKLKLSHTHRERERNVCNFAGPVNVSWFKRVWMFVIRFVIFCLSEIFSSFYRTGTLPPDAKYHSAPFQDLKSKQKKHTREQLVVVWFTDRTVCVCVCVCVSDSAEEEFGTICSCPWRMCADAGVHTHTHTHIHTHTEAVERGGTYKLQIMWKTCVTRADVQCRGLADTHTHTLRL